MTDLATQIQTYLDETAPPLELEDVIYERTGSDPVRVLRPRELGRRKVAWAYGVAALVVITIAVGSLSLVLRSDGPRNPAEQPTSTTVEARGGRLVQPSVNVGAFFDIAVTPVGLLATGGDGLWISQDGFDWELRDDVARAYGLGPSSARSVDATPWGLVAIIDGSIRTPSDGLDWSPLGLGGDFEDVAGSALGVVAVSGDGEVWFSSDGTVWRQSTVPGLDERQDDPDNGFHPREFTGPWPIAAQKPGS